MKIHQLRNATAILHIGERRILIDPMLGDVGAFGGFKYFGGGKRPNPVVPLPRGADEALNSVTDCLITHCQRDHFDHLDPAGVAFLRARNIPLWAHAGDFGYLREKGLSPREFVDGTHGMRVNAVKARHGHGFKGWLLGPGHGWFMHHPDEPSIYVTGDTVLVDSVRHALDELRPDIVVAPAGCANFGFGRDILFPLDELTELASMAPGMVVFNHLEALDHCPTKREELHAMLEARGVGGKCLIPEDGQMLAVS